LKENADMKESNDKLGNKVHIFEEENKKLKFEIKDWEIKLKNESKNLKEK
jgi:hypothetical protein